MPQSPRIEPAQCYGPVTPVVLVNLYGRIASGTVKGTLTETDDGKVLHWYIVDVYGDERPLMVALPTLTCIV